MNNLFQVDENSLEQYFAANIEQYNVTPDCCSILLHPIQAQQCCSILLTA